MKPLTLYGETPEISFSAAGLKTPLQSMAGGSAKGMIPMRMVAVTASKTTLAALYLSPEDSSLVIYSIASTGRVQNSESAGAQYRNRAYIVARTAI